MATAPPTARAAVRQSGPRREASSCAGQRALIRSATTPHAPPTAANRITAAGTGSDPVEGQVDQRGVSDAGGAAGGPRGGASQVARAADVQVDPRPRHELAQEEAAFD